MRTLQPITLSDLLLSRLLLVKDGGLTKGELKKAVEAIAASQLSASEFSMQIERSLTLLEDKGYAETVSSSRYQVTDQGEQYILEQLKLETLPNQLRWTMLRNTYWIAYALNLPALTLEKRKRLADADGLRAVILQSEYDLPIDAFSTLTKTRDALLWQQLCDPSVAQSLQDQIHQLHQKTFKETVMEVLLNNLLQLPKPLKWKQALNQLVAKATGARNDANQLRLAILRRAFTNMPVEPASDPEISEPLTPKPSTYAKEFSDLELENFANTAIAAAKDTKEGRFGEYKVFISHVWQTWQTQQPESPLTLEVFKQRLLEASRQDRIKLSRADLAYSLDAEDIAASEMVYLQSEFHFIRTD